MAESEKSTENFFDYDNYVKHESDDKKKTPPSKRRQGTKPSGKGGRNPRKNASAAAKSDNAPSQSAKAEPKSGTASPKSVSGETKAEKVASGNAPAAAKPENVPQKNEPASDKSAVPLKAGREIKQKPPRFEFPVSKKEALSETTKNKRISSEPDSKRRGGQARQTFDKIKLEGHDSIESIKRMFGAALDENEADIAELSAETPEPVIDVGNPVGNKKRLLLALGIFICVMSIIGIIASVHTASDWFRAFADNTQQKNEFAKFIYPVVICDPPPFDKSVNLRNDTMLTAAIWDIILYADKSKYNAEFDNITVPALEVERRAIELFGQGLSFRHESIMGADVQFYYDEEINSYRIPATPKYFTYSPHIESVTRVGERYTLLVGYVSPTPAWVVLTEEEASPPEKYAEYIVSKRGDDFTLLAINQIGGDTLHGGEVLTDLR